MIRMSAIAKALPTIRRFDPGADLPEPLAQFVWAWEALRGSDDGIPAREAFNLMRLPRNGARAGFVLAPFVVAGADLYRWRVLGSEAKELFGAAEDAALSVADPIAQAALEALLTATPMQVADEQTGWVAMLAPLACADSHVIVGVAAPAAAMPDQNAA